MIIKKIPLFTGSGVSLVKEYSIAEDSLKAEVI